MQISEQTAIEQRYRELAPNFDKWEKLKDIIDQFIDISLNYRLSGHPGGSRSRVHQMVTLLLSGVMRWDIRHPEKRFGDRFVLVAGHTVPVVYTTLACFNEALRAKLERTGDRRYEVPLASERQLTWEDLTMLRRRGGLPGHAEFEGKTLFLKANTGPSGHGSPPALGAAMALKRAGADGVKVFALEGEGGLTTGASHETKNSAWGLGLDNLFYLIDWNNYGIDEFAASDVVHGTPRDWFEPYGWRVFGTDQGSEWEPVTRAMLETHLGPNPERVPNMTYFKTRKGRGYLVYDYKSHGKAHDTNHPLFWELRKQFSEKYGTKWVGEDQPAPKSQAELMEQCRLNLKAVADTMRADQELVDYLADRLVEIGESVPSEIKSFRFDLSRGNPHADKRMWDYENYPKELFVAPGSKAPNRAALAKWGAWVNSMGRKDYGRPLFLAASADLAESTNLHGFSVGFGDIEGWGWYDRNNNPEGALLPQEITEFTNSGLVCGVASVNMSPRPEEEFQGLYGTCSTYGSFSYLKYGPMRLFSQLAQDCDLKVGRVLWVAGHSGPETAEDSRTHFGVFATGVTQLFPDGQIINLIPWEHNEVPVMLGAAFQTDAPIIAIHLTRPTIDVPDRAALGIESHLAAAKGAYLLREYRDDQPKMGTIIVQGTMSTVNTVKLLPKLDELKLNVRLVAAVSPELFKLQSEEYRERVLPEHEWVTSTYITNASRRLMRDWVKNGMADEYAMSADFDNRWRTGGSVDEVIEEAHLSTDWLLKGIQRFVEERPARIARLADALQAARQS